MAKASKLPAITSETVRQWLNEVAAPQPWSIDALSDVARSLDALREQTPHREAQAKNRKRIARAQKAIDELRRALIAFTADPGFKAEEEFWTTHPSGAAADFLQRSTSVRTMLASLADIDGSRPVNKVSVELARDAYQAFQILVPPPASNKSAPGQSNPARLFVEKAVQAMGGKTPAASRLHAIITTRDTAADKYESQHGIAPVRPVPKLENGM